MGAGMYAPQAFQQTYPGFNAGQQAAAQSVGIQSWAQQAQAGNDLTVAGYNAGLAALSGHLTRESEAEQFNSSGVLLSGSPLAQLNQTRQLAIGQINQIQQQGLLQATLGNTQANQTINQGTAALTGNLTNWNSGYANAVTTKENQEAQDVASVFGLGGQALGTANSVVSLANGINKLFGT